jgi:hypothetical protein
VSERERERERQRGREGGGDRCFCQGRRALPLKPTIYTLETYFVYPTLISFFFLLVFSLQVLLPRMRSITLKTEFIYPSNLLCIGTIAKDDEHYPTLPKEDRHYP